MPEVFSFTHLSDGKRVFLGNPQVANSERDDAGYQYFETYEDEYLEDRIGYLGINMSGTVYGLWDFGKYGDAREKLAEIMRLALPLLKLPISSEQYKTIPSGYFPVIGLFSDGLVYYDESTRVVHLPSGKSPEDFFKSTIFEGTLNQENVERIILTYGYLEGINSPFGDFRFPSIEITKSIWPINPQRVTKAFYTLVEDGGLEPTGGNTSSGFPSFTRIPSHTRQIIESNIQEEPETPNQDSSAAPSASVPPYITYELTKSLIESAKNKGYSTKKLEAVISEINDSVARENAQSAHALIRALLDHIPPLFGYNTFAQVTNNYHWSQTDKKRIEQLNTLFRFDADEALHAPISKRDTSADMHSIGIIRHTLNVILEEASHQD
ncbi:hypothetical protein HGB07_03805 [Candidatus Roizmanbacteria bacterium]|nr:hypothetical protein [Candidatus Roizmanbacteria bacterium]